MEPNTFRSINPYNGDPVGEYKALTETELDKKLDTAQAAFEVWRKVPLAERTSLMTNAGRVLREHLDEYARMITLEMGKPILESIAEIEKCAWVCEYYAQNAHQFLKPEVIESDAEKSYVRHEPIGCVLAIMPWNFPFWQVFRFVAPALIAGNTGLLKHAPNVFGCAELIESVFEKAGFPNGVFQNLILHHDKIEKVIAHPSVKAISLTGSERAGASVAALAGKHIKKCVLELGGSNAFMVWEDADMDQAVKTAVAARMLNGGQSCIAAKRFILVESIYDEFISKFIDITSQLKKGDPVDPETQLGPLARQDLAEQLHEQLQRSVQEGAELLYGGALNGCFHEPTILGGVTPAMPVFTEETFGPLAAMVKVKDEEEGFRLAAQSKYGLGITVFTSNIEEAQNMAPMVKDGAYFINEMVKSDPRLPFGGTGYSGYGRELSRDGLMEFVNRQTVYIKRQ